MIGQTTPNEQKGQRGVGVTMISLTSLPLPAPPAAVSVALAIPTDVVPLQEKAKENAHTSEPVRQPEIPKSSQGKLEKPQKRVNAHALAQRPAPGASAASTIQGTLNGQAVTRSAGGSGTIANVGAGTKSQDNTALQNLAPFGQPGGPSFKKLVEPRYPLQARRQGLAGLVLLQVEILPDGKAQRITVVESPSPVLSDVAVAAIRESTFNPMQKEGVAITCWSVVPVRFKLT